MRKLRRSIIRAKAAKRHTKASAFVKKYFDGLQVRKYGEKIRRRNQARGTHKKGTWSYRYAKNK